MGPSKGPFFAMFSEKPKWIQYVVDHPVNIALSLLSNACLLLDLFYFHKILQQIRAGNMSSELFIQSILVLAFFMIFAFVASRSTPNEDRLVAILSSIVGLLLAIMLVTAFWILCFVLIEYGFQTLIVVPKPTGYGTEVISQLPTRDLIAIYMFICCFIFSEIFLRRSPRLANIFAAIPVVLLLAIVLYVAMEKDVVSDFFARNLSFSHMFSIITMSIAVALLVIFLAGRLRHIKIS